MVAAREKAEVCSLVTPPPSSAEMLTKELSLKKVRGGVGRYGEVWGGMGTYGQKESGRGRPRASERRGPALGREYCRRTGGRIARGRARRGSSEK